MPSVLCWLAPLFLTAALIVAAYWWWFHGRPGPHDRPDYLDEPVILGLTRACEQALGPRARPGKLRRTSIDCIAQLLAKADFVDERLPSKDEYRSWPKQAEMLCAGEFAKLREWQREQSGPNDSYVDGSSALPHPLLLTACFLALLALALLIASLALGWCRSCPVCDTVPTVQTVPTVPTVPVVTSTPRVVEEEIATDLLFEFNRAEPYSDHHANELDEQLVELFRPYGRITVQRIVAHTDPVGGDALNTELARRRGEYIRQRISALARDDRLAGRFLSPEIPADAVVAQGASTEDHRFWQACFTDYYLSRPQARPLEDLRPSLAQGRPSCSASNALSGSRDHGPYPGCRRLLSQDAGSVSAQRFFPRLENFRELSACLAPMRHVLVRFQATPLPRQQSEAVQ